MTSRPNALYLAATLVIVLPLLRAEPLAAAPYPDKPIRVVVPSTSGSPPDVLARIVGEKLATALGQAVVIDNRPGAIGTIGLNAVAKAAPDGYTLGIQTMPFVVAPSLLAKMPYDTENDLLAVTQIAWAYTLLVVPAPSPIQSVAQLIAMAKAKPGVLTFASSGNATPSHLGLALLERQAGINLVHIPYKGAPASIAAVLAGDVDMAFCSLQLCSPLIMAGKVRFLATSAPRRLAAYPDLPTLVELGYPGVSVTDWLGVVVPAGTSREVIDRLHSELAKIVVSPEMKQRLEAIGMEPSGAGPEDFSVQIHTEIVKWNKLVREAHISVD
jgi:tripartite-type tricarboxylate transporter receptor subunit TctC